MARKTALICAFAFFQTITGQALNNIRGLNGNGLASSILASNSLLNSGIANGLGNSGGNNPSTNLGNAGSCLSNAGSNMASFGTAGTSLSNAGSSLSNTGGNIASFGIAGSSLSNAGGNVASFGNAGSNIASGLGNSGSNLAKGCGGVASSGGSLPVQSASPANPTGVKVVSDNAYDGSLCVGGNLPLLGSVGLEGTVPSTGQGSVSYGCGSGSVGITNEGPVSTGITSQGSFAPSGVSGFNMGGGYLGRGFGGSCGAC